MTLSEAKARFRQARAAGMRRMRSVGMWTVRWSFPGGYHARFVLSDDEVLDSSYDVRAVVGFMRERYEYKAQQERKRRC